MDDIWLHIFALVDFKTVQLEFEFVSEVLLNMLDIAVITKAQVVDFVREVELVACKVEMLNYRGIMMSADVKIARHFIDEYVTGELAAFFVLQAL